jgi:hypothetical protein
MADEKGWFFAQETGYWEKRVGFLLQETGKCRRLPRFLRVVGGDGVLGNRYCVVGIGRGVGV